MKKLYKNRYRLLVTVLRYSTEILAIIPIFFILLTNFSNSFDFSVDFIGISTIFSFIYFFTFTSTWIIRLRKKWSKFDHRLVKFNTLISLGFLTILLWGISGMYFEKSPQFFPINDPNSTYTIIPYENGYGVHYHTNQKTKINEEKNCTMDKKKLVCTTSYNMDYTAPIGYSPVNLADFVDTDVYITGSFGPNGNGLVVFNIKTISKKIDIH